MEKDFKDTPELDSNRATDGSHVLKQIEKEIKRVEEILLKLEDKSTLLDNKNSIAYSRARSCLQKYLNILYQACRFLVRSVPLAVAQYYLMRMIKYAELYKHTPVVVKIFTQGSKVLEFLVTSLSSATPPAEDKDKQLTEPDYYLKEKAKSLYVGSHSVVPSNTLIVYPVFLPSKKEGNDDQDKDNSKPTPSKNVKLVPRGGLFVNKDHARSNRESPPNDASPNGAIPPRSKDRTNDDITSPLTSPTMPDQALQNNQNRTELDEVPPTTPVQDTCSHTSSDDSYHNVGHVFPFAPLSQLEKETKMTIASFNDTGELPGSTQQQSSPVDNPTPHWQSLAPVINPVQESYDQDDNKVINTHAATVSREEQFKISSSSH